MPVQEKLLYIGYIARQLKPILLPISYILAVLMSLCASYLRALTTLFFKSSNALYIYILQQKLYTHQDVLIIKTAFFHAY